MSELFAYLDAWSVRAGEAVTVRVHHESATSVALDLIDLMRAGDVTGASAVPDTPRVTASVSPQFTAIGSWVELPLTRSIEADREGLTFAVLIRPTARITGTVLAACLTSAEGVRAAWTVQWDGRAGLQLCGADGGTAAAIPAELGRWQLVILQCEASTVTLTVAPHRDSGASATVRVASGSSPTRYDSWWLAAKPDSFGVPVAHLTAAFDSPVLYAGVPSVSEVRARFHGAADARMLNGVLAAWDFGRETHTDVVPAMGPAATLGRLHQGPMRLVPGAYWQPGILDPQRDPAGFSAVRCHADDQRDAGWRPTASLVLPATLASGVYGVRVQDAAGASDVVPLWVRPASPREARPLAVLAPTYTYLAYGNAPDAMLGPAYWGGDHPSEHARRHHPEFGVSLYSRHPDKSGVTMVSRHRPVLTVRPGVRPWGFEADRLLTDWLVREGQSFDVVTDEDLDREALEAIAPYRVLCTGNHPEYGTARMRTALERWIARGGRLCYLGGNGFYWRVSSVSELAGVIECRRPEGGTRPWIADPGEGHHQLDGEAAGLWRRLGAPPQQLVGVGFAGQGFERSAPYRVQASARHGWTAFALEGIDASLIGTRGHFGGGAAGQEIDRTDARLGTSPAAVVLATSQGLHDDATLRTVEELLSHDPPTADPKVRADITLTPVGTNGAVFAVGSMAFVGALDDPPIARLLRNVLQRFLDARPLR
jgi:N,N-dimethylformamidase